MDQFLAELYGTAKIASAPEPAADDLEKEAQARLFLKTASEQNIDLNALPEEKVAELFEAFVENLNAPVEETKVAAEDKKEEPSVAAAKKELEEKKAAAEKLAEADFLGRTMAHAYVDELQKIASAQATTQQKVAAMPPALLAAMSGKKDEKSDDKKSDDKKDDEKKSDDKDEKSDKPNPFAKKASAIDSLAYSKAIELVKDAGFDVKEAADRLNAAATLNLLGESTKVASAQDLNTAVQVRALELLEAVGYPVQWGE